jgi:GNAT superfamily N-acetyltransferase
MQDLATRWSTVADAACLADLHAAAWRYAYSGIIPGVTLERMIGRRGPRWWHEMHRAGGHALLAEFDGRTVGYATLGRGRARSPAHCGEIYELYVRPECQGIGFGRRLFTEARQQLAVHGLDRLSVWALAENQVACRFYRAMGGRDAGRGQERLGSARLAKIRFAWD